MPESLPYDDSEYDFGGEDMPTVLSRREVYSGLESLPADRCLEIYRLMVRHLRSGRADDQDEQVGRGLFLDRRPGEEAFNVCLGLQVKKGHGPAFDYLHLHYRNAGVLVAMGMPMIDDIRPNGDDRHRPPFDGPQFRRPLRTA